MKPEIVQTVKVNSVSEEIEGAFELIWEGMKQINNPALFNLNNSVPLHLLSFGYERFLKTLILMYRSDDEKKFPLHKSPKDAFKQRHNLTILIEELISYMENEPLIVDFHHTQNELSELKNNQKIREFITILEEYGKFQRFHYLNMLVTETPVPFDEMDPYKRFLKFHWGFLPEGKFDPSVEEKIEAQKMFTFLLIDLTRILSRNFYNGISQKFSSQAHGFSNFPIRTNQDLYNELTVKL